MPRASKLSKMDAAQLRRFDAALRDTSVDLAVVAKRFQMRPEACSDRLRQLGLPSRNETWEQIRQRELAARHARQVLSLEVGAA